MAKEERLKIDFVASGPLTEESAVSEQLFGHDILVENSSEIVAKKVWYRGQQFTARDIFDLAMVAEKEPDTLNKISRILQGRRDMVLARIEKHGARLREDFQSLEVLNYSRTFEEGTAPLGTRGHARDTVFNHRARDPHAAGTDVGAWRLRSGPRYPGDHGQSVAARVCVHL